MATELWECDAESFCERGNIDINSPMGGSIHALTLEKLLLLSMVCDPLETELKSVTQDNFVVNYGNDDKQCNFISLASLGV